MKEKLTIIGTFYNEEYLLPYWLKHHTRLFDHGILINWGSTDNSVEIIKRYAPHWEIRDSGTKHFHRGPVDAEMLKHELSIDGGWQIQTNITEFIFHPDLRGYLSALTPQVNGVWLPPISLIDEDPQNPLNPELPIVLQKHFGVIGKNEVRPTNKLIHRKRHGEWKGEGHHDTYMQNVFTAGDIYIVHFGWCPWRMEFIKRKLQVQDKLTKEYKETVGEAEMGYHITTPEILDEKFKDIRDKYCNNLLFNPIYKYLYREIEKSYNDNSYIFNPFLSENINYNLQRISSYLKSVGVDYFLVTKDQNKQECNINVNLPQDKNIIKSIMEMNFTIFSWLKLQFPQFKFVMSDKKLNIIIMDSDNFK